MTLTLSLRPDVTVLAVPYAVHYYRAVFEQGNPHVLWLMSKRPELRYTRRLKLPPGQYEIVGLLRDFKDAEELSVLNVLKAIRKAGGDPEQNWLLLKKIQ